MKYQRVVMIIIMMFEWNLFLLFNLLCIIPTLISGDNLDEKGRLERTKGLRLHETLLSGTLRTYQKAACDEEWMSLRCPSTTTISVQLAQYGRAGLSPALCQNLASSVSASHPDIIMDNSDIHGNFSCHWPQAIQTVVGLCQKKTSCKFQTSPRTFGGDPCPGTRKYVEVAFKCRPSEFKSVIGCQDEVIQLKCNRSSRLAIYSANYGRTEYESVQCPQPSGVPEESCLSSFATETVMQMCHGKRTCALSADPATFGNPCKAESRMYLKVIHTCVPRKVLKEKYQGAPEPDEIFEDDAEDEVIDSSVSGVIEQPSIYSPDHSKGWVATGTKTTVKPNQTPLNQTSGNSDKVYLYVAVSVSVVLFLVVVLILVKIIVYRRQRAGSSEGGNATLTSSKPSSSSAGPILASSGLSDIDELSLVLDPNDITFTELLPPPSIMRHSSSSTMSPPRRETIISESFTGSSSVTSGGNNNSVVPTVTGSLMAASSALSSGRSNEVVRFSNTLGRHDRDLNNPRSLSRNSASNLQFYYG